MTMHDKLKALEAEARELARENRDALNMVEHDARAIAELLRQAAHIAKLNAI